VENMKKQSKTKCVWCGKYNIVKAEWEQKSIMTNEYYPLCPRCATRKLRFLERDPIGIASLIIDIRRIK